MPTRCVVYGQRKLVLEPFDLPASLAPDERLVQIQHSLISPGTDLLLYRSESAMDPGWPLGYTAAGRVVDVGDGVADHERGRPVFLFPGRNQNHCHATHAVADGDALLMPLPDGLDTARACFARMINIALTPFAYATPSPDAHVLVMGAGLVGHMAVQVARAKGFRVIAVDVCPERRQQAAAAGANAVIDPLNEDLVSRVHEMTDGDGAELTINCTGVTETFVPAIEATAIGGEVSTLGSARNPAPDADAATLIQRVQSRHVTLRGGWEMLVPRRAASAGDGPSTQAHLQQALAWLADGTIRTDVPWTHSIRPEALSDTYAAMDAGAPEMLGVIVNWEDGVPCTDVA